MMVLLEAEVFAETSTADLMVLLWLGATRRHRIVVLDDQAPAYTSWLEGLDELTRADWERVVGDGLRQSALEPSYHEVWITARGQSNWCYPNPTLTFDDAVDFLQRPYRILVENGFADRAFLLCMCDRATREFLEDRLSREWLEAEHCGGLGDLEKRAKEVRRHVATRMRCSAMFDSDAMRPGVPSSMSEAIRNICYPDMHFHQLERRTIENYLPRSALDRWCQSTQGRARLDRKAQVEALFALRDEQRAHYNMKEGFGKDLPNVHRAGDLFADIPDETRRLLHDGLDKHIANLYRDGYVHYHELERTVAVAKIQQFAREIVERIR
ncbi:hypothetical protein [Sorangium sp. So ce542]|uniref:hypothetical protein n=1 Tax=Sorangium sp. So ce542 TaxID=3133316 RepID=UPI003F64765B